MSSEEPVRSVPDELFQQVTAKAGRQLPDALFGPPPARPARAEREEPIRSVPDELFKQVTARSERSLPDALFGPTPAPVAAESDTAEPTAADTASGEASGSSDDGDADGDEDQAASAQTSAEVTEQDSDPADVAGSAVAQPDTDEVGEAAGAAPAADPESAVSSGTGAPVPTFDADSPAPQEVPPGGAETGHTVANDVTGGVDRDEPAATSGNDLATAAGRAAASTEVAESIGTAPETSAVGTAAASATAESGVAEADIRNAAEPTDPAAVDAPAPEAEALSTAGGGAEAGAPPAQTAAPTQDSPAGTTAEVALVAEAPSPVSSASPRPVLLVIADSLAYYGPKGGLPADDPRIWPNMVAAELDWDVELIARIGWTCRDAYWALIGDPRVWAAVPRAGAVVFAVGGMDTLPSPLPTALRELIRYIRPPKLRRGVRASYNWLQPKLSKLGRPVALPPRVSVDYLEQSREALNHLRPELPVVAVLPSVHKCDAYGRVHRGRARAVKALRAWSGRTAVPLVDLGEAVRDDIESGAANPDGIHWGWAGHAAVATAMTKALQEVR
ncbi:diglucosylglycerate octanoyltransferase [Nocardia sp. NPDC050717]|uniref:diglucosylglycerate octanoyltransferase n=1 Tax=Nocardia sp. NPDC050717 TaxID=3157221 RepID=UPI0033C9A20A